MPQSAEKVRSRKEIDTIDGELSELLTQEELERVSPKLEAFRQAARIKLCRGGRGAGAKSWGCTSLIVQKAQYKPIRVACLRETQRSLEESSYHLFCATIERLRYEGWTVTKESIRSPAGAHVIFRGLKDYRSIRQMKGLDDFDIFYLDEASQISMQSLDILLPTLFRKDTAELWGAYNPEEDPDPITSRIWDRKRPDSILVELLPGKEDNPWWNAALQNEMEEDFKFDPDLAAHVWLGQPKKQGENSVFTRVQIVQAMRRTIDAVGGKQVGCDVARFGDDRSTIYKRIGLKIVGQKVLQGADTIQVGNAVWDMADHEKECFIKIDAGYNPGVIDYVRKLGGHVQEVNFGGSPRNPFRYTSAADELWFDFPIDEASIPDDTELLRELAGRRFSYDNKGRKKIESKSEYKKRLGRSPDKADGLLLTFYDRGILRESQTSAGSLGL
jgi:phage terminase large subunit